MKKRFAVMLMIALFVGLIVNPMPVAQAGNSSGYDIPDIASYVKVPLVLGSITRKNDNRCYIYDYTEGILSDDQVQPLLDAITRDYPFEMYERSVGDYTKVTAQMFIWYYYHYTGGKSTSGYIGPADDIKTPYQLRVAISHHYAEGRSSVSVTFVPELTYAGDYAVEGQSFSGGVARGGSSGGTDWDNMPSVQKPEVRCSRCNGKGEITCSRCDGKKGKYEYGQTGNYGGSTSPNNGSKRWVNCDKCHGSGMMTCPYCNGSGKG